MIQQRAIIDDENIGRSDSARSRSSRSAFATALLVLISISNLPPLIDALSVSGGGRAPASAASVANSLCSTESKKRPSSATAFPPRLVEASVVVPSSSSSSSSSSYSRKARRLANGRLYRRIRTVDDEDDSNDDDLSEDWRTLKRSVKRIAKKAGKKLRLAAMEGMELIREGGEKMAKAIVGTTPSPVGENRISRSDGPKRESGGKDGGIFHDDLEIREHDYDYDDDMALRLFGRGGLTDLFFGIPNYFSPRGPLVDNMFQMDGILSPTSLLVDGGLGGDDLDRMTTDAIRDAMAILERDDVASSLLGRPVLAQDSKGGVGGPFAREVSTSVVNGETTSSCVRATFGVKGPSGFGVATVSVVDGKVDSLSLDVDGRTRQIDVRQLREWRRRPRGIGGSEERKGSRMEVIDADVVAKA